MTSARNLTYRPEIDGLRAFAVVPVVLYHAGVGYFPGGFVGVDIFFVISGYLISRIILDGIEAGVFSFTDFYERRIRRILPALFVVIFCTLVVGCLVALPLQIKSTANSAIAALFSVSNFFFWLQSGYFAPAAELVPLLHTWSLGVEEQFYIFFPILLLVLSRLQVSTRQVLAIAFLPLFLAAAWLSYHKPSFAFYLLPARAWELILGAILATHIIPIPKHRLVRGVLSSAGLILIVLSLFLIDSRDVFPGFWAIMPCLGAALVINFARDDTLAQQILSLRPLVFIGLISYSLYLWHWPVLTSFRMVLADLHLPTLWAICAITLSFVLATLTWRFVEIPFRDRRRLTGRHVSLILGSAMAVLFCTVTLSIASDGFPGRMDLRTLAMMKASTDIDPLTPKCEAFEKSGRAGECTFGPPSLPVSYVIIGDSHAAAIRAALEHSALFSGQRGALWWRGACPLIEGARKIPSQDNDDCADFRMRTFAALAASPEITQVILAGRWTPLLTGVAPEIGGSYRTYLSDEMSKELSPAETDRVFERSMVRTLEKILAMKKQVILLGSIAEAGFDVSEMLALASLNGRQKENTLHRSRVSAENSKSDDVFRRVVANRNQVTFVSIWDMFCANECALVSDGVPLYRDDDHITYTAAISVVAPILDERFRRLGLTKLKP